MSTLVHWVSNFNPGSGDLQTVGVLEIADGFDAESAVRELYDMGYVEENGFYFVAAPDTQVGEANIGIVHALLTSPPEFKEVNKEKIFIGLSKDEDV